MRSQDDAKCDRSIAGSDASSEAAEALRDLRDYLASQVPELRNRLGALLATVELLEVAPTPERPGLVEDCLEHIEELARRCQGLERLGDCHLPRLRELDLRAWAPGELPGASAGSPPVRPPPAGDPVPARVDPEALARVLGLLLRNAREAAPGEDPEVAIGHDPEGPFLEVRDRGPGLPGDLLDPGRLPGGSSKPGRLGLGLPFARLLLRSMGGRLETCAPGPGGCVRVRLTGTAGR